MAEESQKTFFSYARADSEFVLRLVKDLRAAKADVWLDQLDIGPGQHWDTEVENALRTCQRHVTVLSPAAVLSQNVMDEVSYALEERKQVIPVFYRECIVPFRLRRVQWVDFRTDYASGFRDLARAMGVKGAPAVPAAPIVEPIEQTQAPPDKVSQAVEAAAQPTLMPEQPRREGTTGEAERREEGHREEVGVTVLPPRIWPEPKKLWIAGVVVVVLALGIWIMSSGKAQHDSGTSHEFTPTATPTPDHREATSTAALTPDHSQTIAGDAKSFYQRGANLYKQKQYSQAIDAFTQAIRLDPNYAEAYNLRGTAYKDEYNLERAITDYNQALKLNPNNADAYNNRGLAYQLNWRDPRALKDFDQALKLDPKHVFAYYNRGNFYRDKGDYDLAIQDYTQALRLNPNYVDAYCSRARAYLYKGDYDLAIQGYTRALQFNPTCDDTIYYYRGNAYSSKGDYDLAIEDYNQSLKLYPYQDASAYNARGLVYEKKGQYLLAIQDYDRALKAFPIDLVGAQKNRDRVAAMLAK